MKIVLDYNTSYFGVSKGHTLRSKMDAAMKHIEILRSDLRTMSHHFVHHTIKPGDYQPAI